MAVSAKPRKVKARISSRFGEFSKAAPQTEWVVDKNDRDMLLLRYFDFVDANNVTWPAPVNLRTDGASIPRAFWTLVGSPYTGLYRRAALVHDEACKVAGGNAAKRLAADKMFYSACRAGHCSPAQALVLFLGVRFGAWMPHVAEIAETPRKFSVRLAMTPQEQRLVADFRLVGERLLSRKIADDADAVAQAVDQELAALYPMAARTTKAKVRSRAKALA